MKSDVIIIVFFILVLFLPLVVFMRVYKTTFAEMDKSKGSSQDSSAALKESAPSGHASQQQDQAGKNTA